LEKQSILVVQVKSYEGDHWDTSAVEDIKRAFEHYPEASIGLIISTANSITTAVEKEMDKLREESGKPVAFLVGSDVAVQPPGIHPSQFPYTVSKQLLIKHFVFLGTIQKK